MSNSGGVSSLPDRSRPPRADGPAWARLRPLWDVDTSGWFVYGADWRLVYVNAAFRRLTGATPVLGTQSLVPQVVPESRAALARLFHRLRMGTDDTAAAVVPVPAERGPRPMRLSLTAIDDGRPGDRHRCVVGVVSPVVTDLPTAGPGLGRVELVERVLAGVITAIAEVDLPDPPDVDDEDRVVLLAPDLSERQHDVLRLLVAGERPGAIAARLHLSTHTVRNHAKAIFRKLGVHSQPELIALCRSMQQHPSMRGARRHTREP